MTKDLKRDRSLFFRVTGEEQEEFRKDAQERHMEQAEFFRYIWRAFKDQILKNRPGRGRRGK